MVLFAVAGRGSTGVGDGPGGRRAAQPYEA
jgi:hypothetical protein